MMRIPLDRESEIPLYRQIQRFLAEQIQAGSLSPDTRLPATRELAAALGVGRITVANAYAELQADGLIYTRPGSGTFVASPLIPLGSRNAKQATLTDWPLWQQSLLARTWHPAYQHLREILSEIDHPDPISFAAGLGAPEFFPAEEFRKSLNAAMRREGQACFDYGDRAGYPPLREDVARILSNQGIPSSPDEVLITNGSQQAISLVARLLIRPGDAVLVESPTYINAIDLFRSMDIRVIGIPMDEQGMDLHAAEEALSVHRPRLIYTMPTFQNPTGICMSGHRRRQLIELAHRFQVPILEDDCFGDLRYEGPALPALKALDPDGYVIYVNTFSKILMPGLRIGYLVASGPVYSRLLDCKNVLDLATSQPIQRGLQAYISVGRYQTHLRRACRVYRQRRDAALEALASHMPTGVRWLVPRGGLFLWLELPDPWSADDLFPVAAAEGVVFAPGSHFFPAERSQPCLRLNFVIHPPERAREGIKRLGIAMHKWMQGLRPSHREMPDRRVAV